MKKAVYPLLEVLQVKQRRVDEAERNAKEKKIALEKEEEALAERKAARDEVKVHQQSKLNQFRQTLDEGTTSPKIQQMKAYLKVVEEKLKVEEKKVRDQEELVKTAQKNYDEAVENLRIKRQEVDKLLIHQKDWEKMMKKEEDLIESRDQDELGFLIHLSNLRKSKSDSADSGS